MPFSRTLFGVFSTEVKVRLTLNWLLCPQNKSHMVMGLIIVISVIFNLFHNFLFVLNLYRTLSLTIRRFAQLVLPISTRSYKCVLHLVYSNNLFTPMALKYKMQFWVFHLSITILHLCNLPQMHLLAQMPHVLLLLQWSIIKLLS